MNRYKLMYDVVRRERPKSILEIGTNFGVSAVNLIIASQAERYVGFDLFEDANEETDAREFNVKQHPEMEEMRKFLKGYTGVDVQLIKGDTNKTLPEFLKTGEKFDFAFIDGGHSVATIKNDWYYVSQMMNPNGMVVFDDYYHNKEGMGCNEIVENLPHQKAPLIATVKKTGLQVGMVLVRMADLKGNECIGYL